jgi:RNA polymerase sigma-70 factor (ECF subfamily)
VKRHAGRAIASASLLLRNHHDALDASQDAFVRAWRGIRRLRSTTRFQAWYSAILRNVCLSRLRRPRHPTVAYQDGLTPSDDGDPSVLVERDEQTHRLWAAMLRLPVHQRDILLMSHFHQMSYKQMAALLGVPMGTVMSRLHNARKALARALGREAP